MRKLHAMRGRSVFAKFKDRVEFEGMSVEDLKARASSAEFERGLGQAVLKAIEQIEKVDARAQNAAGDAALAAA